LSTPETINVVSATDVESVSQKIEKVQREIDNLQDSIVEYKTSITSYEEKIKKIEDVRSAFSVEELQKQQDVIVDLEMKYTINLKDLESKDKELDSLRRNIEILNSVPCGDSFPTCVFIKDAHNSKKILDIEEKTRIAIQRTIDVLRDKLSETSKDDIKNKIDKINKLSSLEKDLSAKKSYAQSHITLFTERLGHKNSTLDTLKSEHKSLIKQIKMQSESGLYEKHKEYVELKKEIDSLESQMLTVASSLGRLTEKLSNTDHQIQTLRSTLEKFETLTLLENAFSKKGIPQNIIAKNLPLINSEISKILIGISGFTVEIECDDSSSIEIYINYGDRRRIIELGSGMEKMIASIAIRVALTNISSLPKSDMLIIDEGFGVLDESNLEACARLLQNLKNYFRKILIISHVDAIKDIVDNILSIDSSNGKARVSHE
jgi:exonuclease SbcC